MAIHIHDSKDGQYFFIVKAKNGKTLMHSETYKRKRSALKGIAALRVAVKGKVKDLTTPKGSIIMPKK